MEETVVDNQVLEVEEIVQEENEIINIKKQIDLVYNLDELKKMAERKQFLTKELAINLIEEEKINETNFNKVLVNWRNLMVQLTKEELGKEVDVISNSFSRNLEIKNEFLETLKKRYQDSKKQYQLVLQNHIIHVDKFNELKLIKIDSIRKNFHQDLDFLG